jgi:Na+/proline symporter
MLFIVPKTVLALDGLNTIYKQAKKNKTTKKNGINVNKKGCFIIGNSILGLILIISNLASSLKTCVKGA